jgi:hypothetical protein
LCALCVCRASAVCVLRVLRVGCVELAWGQHHTHTFGSEQHVLTARPSPPLLPCTARGGRLRGCVRQQVPVAVAACRDCGALVHVEWRRCEGCARDRRARKALADVTNAAGAPPPAGAAGTTCAPVAALVIPRRPRVGIAAP